MTIPYHSSLAPTNVTIICAWIVGTRVQYAKIISKPVGTGWTTPVISWGMSYDWGNNDYCGLSITAGAGSEKAGRIDIAAENVTCHMITSFKYDGTANYNLRLNGFDRTVTYTTGAAVTGNIYYTTNTDLALFTRSTTSLGEYGNFFLGDLIVYGTALSSTDIIKVETYLKNKYGVCFVPYF
jgi:hypothetical protein